MLESLTAAKEELKKRTKRSRELSKKAENLLQEAQKKHRMQIIHLRKKTLSEAIKNGNVAILNWCHRRAIESHFANCIDDLAVFGHSAVQISDEESIIVMNRVWRWYHRICTWWSIDPGYGEMN